MKLKPECCLSGFSYGCMLRVLKCYEESFSSETALRAILENCPELVKLKCFNYNFLPNNLEFVAEHNQCLESLLIFNFKATNAVFSHLKKLFVCDVTNAHYFASFIKANPTIGSLSIMYLHGDRSSSESLDFLINDTGLKHVEIGGDDSAVEKVFRKIKTGFGTWKTLRLEGKLDFIFLENPADWPPSD